jgi:CBS domain-containing protein
MKISDIVRTKGDHVVTIGSDATVLELLALLDDHGIGAVVVSDHDGSVDGIVSERDIVRHLHCTGPAILTGSVSAIMTSEVYTCTLHERLDDIEATMTERRIRHVPVVEDGVLRAIVSIGDVVKNRITDLRSERDQLASYINQ